MDKFNELRSKYENFIFDSFSIEELENSYKITYNFEIEGLTKFNPYIEIDKKYLNKINDSVKYFLFHIGLIELISYYKCATPKNIIIKAGYLNDDQIKFFKKLYYYGLGEFLYVNNIDIDIDSFISITCIHPREDVKIEKKELNGILIPIGGGKDSCVSLEILGNCENLCFMINPKQVMFDCIEKSGYDIDSVIVKRVIDKKLIELNDLGYLNGHTPFSSLVAFTSYLMAYLTGKKYIALSNEGSANESTVLNTKINHQYSKTFEFENDFNNYTKKYFDIDIKYFSFLRPLSELQIAMLFSNYKKYHKVFKSCNVGSKSIPWKWCCKCAKCLFVYIILSPFLYKDDLVDIFKTDLYDDKELLTIFKELIGDALTKPFECVGTTKEVRFSVSYVINKLKNSNIELPYLLKYYDDNYELYEDDLLNEFNLENNLDDEFISILRKELEKCIKEL